MFDRKRSEGATEGRQRDRGEIEGRREGWMSEREDNCAREGTLRLGSLFLSLSVEQPNRHIWIIVNNLAGDQALVLQG